MAQLRLLESATGDRRVAGVLISWPSGRAVEITLRRSGGVLNRLGLAKRAAAEALDHAMRAGWIDEADGTNWASVVAGLAELIRQMDFDGRVPGGEGQNFDVGSTPSAAAAYSQTNSENQEIH